MDIESTISKVVKNFDKMFGEGTATPMELWQAPGYAPTGLLALDYIIGRPGWPIGRYSELAGPFSSAKSAIMANTIGACQKKGMLPILLDLEHSYDPFWLKSIFGVDSQQLLCLDPPTIEAVFDHIKAAITVVRESGNESPIIVVVDSVSAQPSFKESERTDGTESKQMAEHAKIISAGCRELSHIIKNGNAAVVFVSQLRDNPGKMYGENSHKLGGKAIEFHSGLLIETRRRAYIKHGNKEADVAGYKLIIETKKNKYAPPFRKVGMEYEFLSGFDHEAMLVEFMAKAGMIEKSASGWYTFEGKKCRRDELKFAFPDDQTEKVYQSLGITEDATFEDLMKTKLSGSPGIEPEEDIDTSEAVVYGIQSEEE
jgi:protein RecA